MTASSRLIGERRSGLPRAKVQSLGTPKPRRGLVPPTPFLTELPALSSLLAVLQSHGLLINPWAGAPKRRAALIPLTWPPAGRPSSERQPLILGGILAQLRHRIDPGPCCGTPSVDASSAGLTFKIGGNRGFRPVKEQPSALIRWLRKLESPTMGPTNRGENMRQASMTIRNVLAIWKGMTLVAQHTQPGDPRPRRRR